MRQDLCSQFGHWRFGPELRDALNGGALADPQMREDIKMAYDQRTADVERDLTRVREALTDLVEEVRRFTTEADYTVQRGTEEDLTEALHAADMALAVTE